MTKFIDRAAATLILALLAAACASGGRAGALSWNVGEASETDAQEKTIEVLRKYFYEIERQEDPPSIYVITRWKSRHPFDDEIALGAVEARTRFIVEARRGSQPLYTVRLRGENEVRIGDSFERIEATPEFRTYADELAEELRTVLLMGIRR
ncbi:MAG TPA: hypothetical protein VMM79_11550 [Longimicrobiales bacterium]|nr:hypothetical protein [Longimicrobiales bacterium]